MVPLGINGTAVMPVTVRPATKADLAAVDALLARSYPVLLKPDYSPSVLVTALPLISRARPELVASGTYYLAETEDGRLVGAGGWTYGPPAGGAVSAGLAHVRHVVTDPAETRRGVGRALMTRVMLDAAAAGAETLDCLSTRTAVPFYAALGFEALESVEVTLRPGISFPAVHMVRGL